MYILYNWVNYDWNFEKSVWKFGNLIEKLISWFGWKIVWKNFKTETEINRFSICADPTFYMVKALFDGKGHDTRGALVWKKIKTLVI